MTGLRKLRILDSSRHNPAVGILYGSKPVGRLLIVGLSHYGIEMGRGGIFLNLTEEQYAKLRR